MGNIVIHLLVKRHHPAHRADGNGVVGQQAPDAKLAGIRMPLLQVIHLDHQGQPDLARWGFGGAAFVLKARQVFRFKPANPQRDGGTGDLQKTTKEARQNNLFLCMADRLSSVLCRTQ